MIDRRITMKKVPQSKFLTNRLFIFNINLVVRAVEQ